jgi:predicted aspartyl protease
MGATSLNSALVVAWRSFERMNRMGNLILPQFPNQQMGQVIVSLTVSNRIDQVLAERGFISGKEVRSCTLTDVLVDTGATMLCLPTSVIQQLGLVQGTVANVETAAGVREGRIFRDVELSIADRQGTFDCLELTDVSYALLGVTPMEVLGLEPDLKTRTLRVLPMDAEQTYLSIL